MLIPSFLEKREEMLAILILILYLCGKRKKHTVKREKRIP